MTITNECDQNVTSGLSFVLQSGYNELDFFIVSRFTLAYS